MNTALLTFTVNPGRAALASNGQTAAEGKDDVKID